MSYSFEYIDIILLAMIAGFIFLRLRGILGKRTGFDGKAPSQFDKILKEDSIIGISILKKVAKILSSRLRKTNDIMIEEVIKLSKHH